MGNPAGLQECRRDSCYISVVKPKYASPIIFTRRLLRWLVWSWCVCFLGVTLMAPISAALMVGNGEIGSNAHSMEHRTASSVSHSTPHAVHHHEAEALCCDSCAQDTRCLNNCLHCSTCYFSVVSAPVVSSPDTPTRVSAKIRLIRTTTLPNLHANPPYRPPIA